MNKVIDNVYFLFLLLIMTFMDSYKVFPSKYRPLFLWVLIILFPLALTKEKKISRNVFYLLIAYFYMGSISFFKGLFVYRDFTGFFDYIITVLLFIIAYTSYKYIFRNTDFSKIDKALVYSGNFLVFIGVLEMLSYYSILPISIKKVLNVMLTERYTTRFKLITNEASWASMVLLFYYSYFLEIRKKIQSFLIAILIILSFSTQGIISLFIYNMYLYLKKSKNKINTVFYLIVTLIICGISFIILKNLILLLSMENTYFGSRFFKLKVVNFEEFLTIDGSIFIRIGYPLAGLKIWTKNISNFFMGIGGGNYIFEFEDAIKEVSLSYTLFSEVVSNIKTLSANVKNLYIRWATEGGIITVFIVLKFVFLTYKKLIRLNNKFLNNTFVVLLVIYLQFDSYIYLLSPLILALTDIYSENKN